MGMRRNNKIFDMKAFKDNKFDTAQMMSCLSEQRKQFWIRRKCWLLAFGPFPKTVYKGFLSKCHCSLGLCGKG